MIKLAWILFLTISTQWLPCETSSTAGRRKSSSKELSEQLSSANKAVVNHLRGDEQRRFDGRGTWWWPPSTSAADNVATPIVIEAAASVAAAAVVTLTTSAAAPIHQPGLRNHNSSIIIITMSAAAGGSPVSVDDGSSSSSSSSSIISDGDQDFRTSIAAGIGISSTIAGVLMLVAIGVCVHLRQTRAAASAAREAAVRRRMGRRQEVGRETCAPATTVATADAESGGPLPAVAAAHLDPWSSV
ncbi:hypothetical protein BX600DRAFT_548562 [Xylariales sp. PMI_506]|nr:hypothetical protein BX600DRAFT_548562 [Xylariales sp. PMI_506]